MTLNLGSTKRTCGLYKPPGSRLTSKNIYYRKATGVKQYQRSQQEVVTCTSINSKWSFYVNMECKDEGSSIVYDDRHYGFEGHLPQNMILL